MDRDPALITGLQHYSYRYDDFRTAFCASCGNFCRPGAASVPDSPASGAPGRSCRRQAIPCGALSGGIGSQGLIRAFVLGRSAVQNPGKSGHAALPRPGTPATHAMRTASRHPEQARATNHLPRARRAGSQISACETGPRQKSRSRWRPVIRQPNRIPRTTLPPRPCVPGVFYPQPPP